MLSAGSPAAAAWGNSTANRSLEVPRETIFYESTGPAPVSMGSYEQTGDLVDGSGHSRPLLPWRLTPSLSRRQLDKIRWMKRFAKEQSVKYVMLKQQEKHQMLQMQNLKRAQALLLLSRVYVGSINHDVTEQMIAELFSAFGPIKSCNLGYDSSSRKHKGYAFVEYELPEPAGLSIEVMNNVVLSGRNLKVSRPSNIPNHGPLTEELIREYNLYNRVYVANVHPQLSEAELRSVFEAFGQLTSCRLEAQPQQSGRHRGYGFLEFGSPQAAVDAIANMNGFDLGGQLLRVCRAVTPPNVAVGTLPSVLPTAAAVAAANITAQLLAQEAENVVRKSPNSSPGRSRHSSGDRRSGFGAPADKPLPPPQLVVPQLPQQQQQQQQQQEQQQPEFEEQQQIDDTNMDNDSDFIRGKEARRLVMHKLMRQSRVVLLTNMVLPDEVDDALEGEVNEECGRYGFVQRVVILQQAAAVRIFVEFSQSSEAEAARQALDGRFFAGREVRARLYDEGLWQANDLQS